MGKYTIYLRRNKVNGKCYVGQTCDFKWREYDWKCLKGVYANNHIDEDRVKYGFDAWTVEILGEVDTREEAWELEKRFINDYNTLWPNGYNLNSGGLYGYKPSDETRQKMSEAKKGKQFNREDQSKLVYQYTLDGTLVKVWPSTNECGRNGFKQGNVSNCCNGKLKTHKGFKWSYTPI